jgi:hypothetical protein
LMVPISCRFCLMHGTEIMTNLPEATFISNWWKQR